MYLLQFNFDDPDTRFFFAVLGLIVWCAILYFIIKAAVQAGVKDLHQDIVDLINRQNKTDAPREP